MIGTEKNQKNEINEKNENDEKEVVKEGVHLSNRLLSLASHSLSGGLPLMEIR